MTTLSTEAKIVIEPSARNAARPIRILIVDDDRDNRELLALILSWEGFVTVTAASGVEALQRIALEAPDLVLLDVIMPDMNGYEVIGQLKADPATKDIPVIMVSALGDREAGALARAAGAVDYVTKPIDRARLCLRIKKILGDRT